MLTLYHGTSSRRLQSIRKHGLVPRGTVRGATGNFRGWRRSKDFVYLTDCFAMSYAMRSQKDRDEIVIIRATVEEEDLYPDEDFICLQKNAWPEDMKLADRHRAVDLYGWQEFWSYSLKHHGTVATPLVAPDKLEVRIVPNRLWADLGGDLSLSPLAHQLLGAMYRAKMDEYFAATEPPP